MKKVMASSLIILSSLITSCGSKDNPSVDAEIIMQGNIGNAISGKTTLSGELASSTESFTQNKKCQYTKIFEQNVAVGVYQNNYIVLNSYTYTDLNTKESDSDCESELEGYKNINVKPSNTKPYSMEAEVGKCKKEPSSCSDILDITYKKIGNKEIVEYKGIDEETQSLVSVLIESIANEITPYLKEYTYLNWVEKNVDTNEEISSQEIALTNSTVKVTDKTNNFKSQFLNKTFKSDSWESFSWKEANGKFILDQGHKSLSVNINNQEDECFYDISPEVMNVFTLTEDSKYYVSINENGKVDEEKTLKKNIKECQEYISKDSYDKKLEVFTLKEEGVIVSDGIEFTIEEIVSE